MRPVINIESWINKLQYGKIQPGLRDGQLFVGKVIKFYPNEMAEVLVNGMRLMAKMDVSVQVRHIFQVNQSENGYIQLKVLPTGEGLSNDSLPNQLMNAFQLKPTKIGTILAELVIDNQAAITKESFKTALDWIQSTADSSARLQIVRLAILNQLPIHNKALDALLSIDTGKSLTSMLESLFVQLQGFSDADKYLPLIRSMDEILQTGKSELYQKIAVSLLEEGNGIFEKTGIIKANKAAHSNDEFKRLIEWIDRVYKGIRTRPTELTEEEWIKIQGRILKNEPYIYLDRDATIYRALNSILESLGVAGIKGHVEVEQSRALQDMLRHLTLEDIPNPLKHQAEAIMTRLAAFQLLSQETGPLQNVFMQIPIPFAELNSDLTLQWTGRKQEDGTIDPAYCRIVFYLELSRLKKTIIDMNIQNRIISLKIWTEEEKQANKAAISLLPILRENLAEKGYQLTTLKIENFSLKRTNNEELKKPYYSNSGYSGVDYKV